MDPTEYCRTKAAPAGSVGYYVARSMPDSLRRYYVALSALCADIEDGINECTDPAVVHSKHQWWSEELERLRDGAPRHPASRGWLVVCPQPDDAELRAYLDHVAAARVTSGYPDWPHVHAHLDAIGGIPWRLLSRHAGASDLSAVGGAIALTRRIADLGLYARRGQALLPESLLRQFAASGATLFDADPALFAAATAHCRDRLSRSLAELPAEMRSAHPYAGVAVTLTLTLLREIERDGNRLLKHRIYLTPLQRAWTAWRALRHERAQR